mgnify:CR=1 FL=1|tara:strand:+ start:2403 stop:3077 length:675 start_codon:yes stop_codon:yes gene_type:complete
MKTILITGSSSGIGRETAILAAKKGNKVIAISRNISELNNIKNIKPFSVDLSDKKSIKDFIKKIKKNSITIDVLINNAGLLEKMPFSRSGFDIFEKVYRVNVFGLSEITRLILPFIKKNGHVVNISSIGGVQGSQKFSGLSAYSSSKAAVIGLTELLAEEFKDSGPAFNALAIGSVQTEMLNKAFPGYKANVSPGEFASYLLEFSLNGHNLYNGKVLSVSLSTP